MTMSESDKSVFLFRIPPDLKIALRDAAWRARVPMGDFAEAAIREKLEREASKTGEVLTPAGE
jgi:hypothetical protein